MKDLSPATLEQVLNDPETTWGTHDSNYDVKIPFEISSEKFLQYAECDISSKYEHSLVNALSNIKRAIDCRIETLLFVFGVFEKSKKENWSFPSKVEFLAAVGIVSPRILKRINQKRNLLEHEYKIPAKEDVEDALDVAVLFKCLHREISVPCAGKHVCCK